jgi:hypothetical protein
LDKAFEADWRQIKVGWGVFLIKCHYAKIFSTQGTSCISDLEQRLQTKCLLREHYSALVTLFKHFCVTGRANPSPFNLGMQTFAAFCVKAYIAGQRISRSDIDTIFLVTNIELGEDEDAQESEQPSQMGMQQVQIAKAMAQKFNRNQKRKNDPGEQKSTERRSSLSRAARQSSLTKRGSVRRSSVKASSADRNHAQAIERFEWLEALVRLALSKYVQTGMCTTPFQAVDLLLEHNVLPLLNEEESDRDTKAKRQTSLSACISDGAETADACVFRQKFLYTEDTCYVMQPYVSALRTLHRKKSKGMLMI